MWEECDHHHHLSDQDDIITIHQKPTNFKEFSCNLHGFHWLESNSSSHKEECDDISSDQSSWSSTEEEDSGYVRQSSSETDSKLKIHPQQSDDSDSSNKYQPIITLERRNYSMGWNHKRRIKSSRPKPLRKHICKDFIQKFLNNSFQHLASQFKHFLLSHLEDTSDRSHILKILASILKIITSSTSPHHFTDLLSDDVIGYLTSEGVAICEMLEKTHSAPMDILLPRIHLLVTIFLDILDILENVTINHDKTLLNNFKHDLLANEELCRFFPRLMSDLCEQCIVQNTYLSDLILTNHKVILLLERFGFDLVNHLQRFATFRVMECYGLILRDFKTNSDLLNECILTMMYHVAGELGSPHVLYRPDILRIFCAILEERDDRWEDPISFVLNQFYQCHRHQSFCIDTISERDRKSSDMYRWYLLFENDPDPIGKIADQLQHRNWTKQKIIEQLYMESIITKRRLQELLQIHEEETGVFVEGEHSKEKTVAIVKLAKEFATFGL